jgi:hypothetical protein
MATEPATGATPAAPAATVTGAAAASPTKTATPARPASSKAPVSPFLRAVVEAWQARQELRWRVDPSTPAVAPVLEQRWTSTLNKDEWRPVPTVSIKAGA